MSDRAPDYKVYVDWFGHGALNAGLANWSYSESVSTPVDVSMVDSPSLVSGESIRVQGGAMYHPFNVVEGPEVDYRLRLWNPSADGPVDGLVVTTYTPTGALYDTTTTTATDVWDDISLAYDPAIVGEWTVRVRPNDAPEVIDYPVVTDVVHDRGDGASWSIAAPSGSLNGQLLLLFHVIDTGISPGNPPPTGGTPWLPLEAAFGLNQFPISGGGSCLIWWKVGGPSEPGSYLLQQADSADSEAVVMAVENVNPNAITSGSLSWIQGEDPADTVVTSPAVTMNAPGGLDLRFGGTCGNVSITHPPGWTSLAETTPPEWAHVSVSERAKDEGPGTEELLPLQFSTTEGRFGATVNLPGVVTPSDIDPDSVFYIGWFSGTTEYDDVSCDLAATRQPPDITYGRDSSRDLDTVRPGEIGLELKNNDGRYTPGNPASPLVDVLIPNRQVLITADFNGRTYIMYSGYTEDYILDASLNAQSVTVPCTDLLGRLATTEVATPLYDSERTGDVFRMTAEEAGLFQTVSFGSHADMTGPFQVFHPWIDLGASTLRWWSFVGPTVEAFKRITESEGPPAVYSVGSSNQIVFRDRLHRQRADYPAAPVAVLTGCDDIDTFRMHESSSPNYGWRDVANQIDYTYDLRNVDGEYTTVWSQPGDRTWGGAGYGDVATFTGIVPSGFYDAQQLVPGRLQTIENQGPVETNVLAGILPEDHDVVILTGNFQANNNQVIAPSGTRVSVQLRDNTGGPDSITTIRDISMRAKAVQTDTVPQSIRDEASIAAHGSARALELDLGSVPAPDAQSIAQLTLSKRSTRRPTVTAVIKNLSPEYMEMMLGLDLGAPVRVDVDQWAIDEVFAIEAMTHEVRELGEEHIVTLYMEQERPGITNDENAFTFDEPGQGFDEGMFGASVINPDTVFRLGESEIGGTDVLTY